MPHSSDPSFIETIRILKGVPCHLPYHTSRINATLRALGSRQGHIDLADIIRPQPSGHGVQKCRVVYDRNGITDITCHPYTMRPVASLRLVTDDEARYPLKSTDRSVLTRAFDRRGDCDDIIIVRHGLLTDTSIANIALHDGDRWYTPASPLLPGTTRARLIDEGIISPRDIAASELDRYTAITLFNAMIAPFCITLARAAIVG